MAATETRPFSAEELSKIRSKTVELMVELDKKDPSSKSWISDGHEVGPVDQRSKRCLYFDTHGFIKVDNFAGTLCPCTG
jgi:hypothetical protein